MRGGDKFAAAEGIALQADDILELPAPLRLARLDFADGLIVALGAGSRALLGPRLTGERAGARLYLLAGWAKVAVPATVRAIVAAPGLDITTTGGIVVISVQPTATLVFAEAGDARLRRKGAGPQPLATGEFVSWAAAEGAKPDVSNRPPPAFVAALPRAFVDAMPTLAAKLQQPPTLPRRSGALTYADAQPWLDAEPALRQANLPRWRALAGDPQFRRGLKDGLKSHPEWRPILFPPSPRSAAYPPRPAP